MGIGKAISSSANLSASSMASSGLCSISEPMVEVRRPAPVVVQNEPSPCVGNRARSGGRAARRRSETYWRRASERARSGPRRSGRPAEVTSRLPPEKIATGSPSMSTR